MAKDGTHLNVLNNQKRKSGQYVLMCTIFKKGVYGDAKGFISKASREMSDTF